MERRFAEPSKGYWGGFRLLKCIQGQQKKGAAGRRAKGGKQIVCVEGKGASRHTSEKIKKNI